METRNQKAVACSPAASEDSSVLIGKLHWSNFVRMGKRLPFHRSRCCPSRYRLCPRWLKPRFLFFLSLINESKFQHLWLNRAEYLISFYGFYFCFFIGFVLGTRQTILETKDGGNTWVPRSIPSAEDEDLNSICFKGKEGWIVAKPAILLYTSDAGESWQRIPLSAQLPGEMVSSLSHYIIIPSINGLYLNLFSPLLCISSKGTC